MDERKRIIGAQTHVHAHFEAQPLWQFDLGKAGQ